MAFEAIISAERIDTALEIVGAFVDECRIHVDEDALSIRAVDPANVAMVEMSLDAAAFESYEGDGGTIGVDLGRLNDALGMVSGSDLVFFQLDPETQKLRIECNEMEYQLALIDPESIRQEPDLPDVDLPAHVVAEGETLKRALSGAGMVSDHVRLAVDENEETFAVTAAGDVDDVSFEYPRDSLVGLTPAPADSLFSEDYLGDISSILGDAEEVDIHLGEEFPVRLAFEFADHAGDAEYMISPRVQAGDSA